MAARARSEIAVGDYVLLTNNRFGLVQYHGKVRFSIGYWYGIEMVDTTITRHNGMVLNKRYFTCPANKGLFVKRECIIKIIDENKINDIKNDPLKLGKHKKRRKRTPKYRLDKEKRKLASLAMLASKKNKLIPPPNTPKKKQIHKHKNRTHISMDIDFNELNVIPIERVANELLSDNESIELDSDEAEMHLYQIVIERNLINHGDNEYRDIFMDNFINDMNQIEYSVSVSADYIDSDSNNHNIPNLKNANSRALLIDHDDNESNKQQQINIHDANNCHVDDEENYLVPLDSELSSQIKLGYYDREYQGDKEGDDEYINDMNGKLLSKEQMKYLLIRRGVIPSVIYGVLNALIVVAIYAFFSDNEEEEKEYWSLNVNEGINELFDTNWPDLPWILMADFLITTILESISIWFFIGTFVDKDLRNEKISGLHNSFDIDRYNCFIFCIIKLMRNGLKSSKEQISFCHRCGRNIISTFMCLIFSLIIFYIPIILILCIFVNDQVINNLDYFHIVLFKATYGAIIAIVLSPLTAFLTLTSNAISYIASEYDPDMIDKIPQEIYD